MPGLGPRHRRVPSCGLRRHRGLSSGLSCDVLELAKRPPWPNAPTLLRVYPRGTVGHAPLFRVHLLQLVTVPGGATDLLLIYLRAPRRTELIELAIQVLLQRTHPSVTGFLPHNDVLVFVEL